MQKLSVIWRFLKDLGAYQALRPYDIYPYFFLSSFALVILVLLAPDYFAQWPGYSALATAGGSAGAGRFLIDASLPVALLYIAIILMKLNRARCQAVNDGMRANTVHRYPLIGAVFFIVQLPLLVLLYEAQDDFVYTLTKSFWVIAYCMPWFSYLAANSFSIIVAAVYEWRQKAVEKSALSGAEKIKPNANSSP